MVWPDQVKSETERQARVPSIEGTTVVALGLNEFVEFETEIDSRGELIVEFETEIDSLRGILREKLALEFNPVREFCELIDWTHSERFPNTFPEVYGVLQLDTQLSTISVVLSVELSV